MTGNGIQLMGFTDEVDMSIDIQIDTCRQLGWNAIELRQVGSGWAHDIEDDEFGVVACKLQDAGIQVPCLGSAIMNWASVNEPFAKTVAQADRAIERMKRLDTRYIRVMSYPILQNGAPDDQNETERFRRVRDITRRFTDAGLVPLHENCMNYGGMGPSFTLRLLEAAPGLKLVFDTGNPVHTLDYEKEPPRPRQSSWDFYRQVREHILHVHIKDCRIDPETGKPNHTYPGEGDGDVRRILADLLDSNYTGGLSIEPHNLSPNPHDLTDAGNSWQDRQKRFIRYGRMLEAMLAAI